MRIFIIFLTAFCLSWADEWKVVHIADGDTITVSKAGKKLKIRFWGIDAPESTQRYGKFCTKMLARKLNHKRVSLQIKATDKYKRKVAKVFVDGEDINRYMVQNGCAWAYTYYTKAYWSDQQTAKKQRLGLWQDLHPIEPYQWRKSHPRQHSKARGSLQKAILQLKDELCAMV